MIRHRLIGLPLVLLAACGKGPASTAIVTRDSAGVTIIEHSEAAVAASPLWKAGAPSVTIAHGATPDQTFSWIASAARLADGRVVLVDGQNDGSVVLVYGPDGTFLRQLGRVGMGPGEFKSPRLLAAGDTLAFYDIQQSRLTRMTPEGTLVGTSDMSRFGPMAIGIPAGVLGDGRLVTAGMVFGDTSGHGRSRYRQVSPLVVVNAAADHLDTLSAGFPGNEVELTTMNFGAQSRTLPTAIGYGKRSFVLPTGTTLQVATNENSALDTYAVPWTLKRSVRFGGARRPVDDEARTAVRADAIANVEKMGPGAGPMKQQFIDMINRAGIADSIPWIQGIVDGGGGTLWLREARSVSDSVPHYLIVGADGKLVARADLPRGSRLLWAGADQVLISLNDADDVPRLELRPITKGTPTP